jgi:hypothetical protein
LGEEINCGAFKIDSDIVESTTVIEKRFPVYMGEDIAVIKPEKNFLNNVLKKFKKSKPKVVGEIFYSDAWEYVTIKFLILRLTKAVVIYHDKLPKYRIKHTRKNIKKIFLNNIDLLDDNQDIKEYINEFNTFLKYLNGKEELPIKVEEVKRRIDSGKRLAKINKKNKKEDMVEEIKK